MMKKLSGTGRHYRKFAVAIRCSRSKAAVKKWAAEIGGWIEEVSEERLIATAISPDDPDLTINAADELRYGARPASEVRRGSSVG